MQTLRTTINPTEEITVDDREAQDLEALGVVLTGTRATTDDGLLAAAVRQVTGEAPQDVPVPAPRARAPRKRAARKPTSGTPKTPAKNIPAGDTSTTTTDAGENVDVSNNGGDAGTKEG